MPLALRIPGARKTEIIRERVHARLSTFEDRVNATSPDGVFPGQDPISGMQQLTGIVNQITDPSDFAILDSEKYVDAYLLGLRTGQQIVPMPKSKYLLDALSIPSTFVAIQKTYRRLLKEYKR